MSETDLKFDEPKVCTELAEEYLRNKNEFCSVGVMGKPYEKSNCKFDYDQFENKIYFIEKFNYISLVNDNQLVKQGDTMRLFLALAQKIEVNAQLFCELEFLNRKIPMNNTKNVDLKLINQSLVLKSSYVDNAIYTSHTTIFVRSNTPLFHLGLFAYVPPSRSCTLVCTKTTAAVCTLFVELCNDVGLGNKVKLAIQEDIFLKDNVLHSDSNFDTQLAGGCVGVVTARCDVDSAVDAFLAAPAWYPWRLRRVLVQEPAMERFTRALTARTSAAGAHDSRQADDKIFLLEFVGDEKRPDESGQVRVEAYRTTKEALGLLAARPPLAVSAWASDGAEANEIAFGVDCPIVWINNYGQFHGPPLSAAALYTREEPLNDCALDVARLRGLKTSWLTLTMAARLHRVRQALDKYHEQSLERIEGEVGLSCDTAVTADDNLCIAIRKPVEITRFNSTDPDHILKSPTFFLNYIIEGGAVLILNQLSLHERLVLLMELLMEVGAPILKDATLRKKYPNNIDPLYKVKATWTSIGTTFAN